jgi:hypothetical protein
VRRHPHLYEINTWPWLKDLSRQRGRAVTLGSVPDDVWDSIASRGFDLVYLMGIWARSDIGRQIARSDPGAWAAFDGAAAHWRIPDVVGSAFSIKGYDPDPALGSMDDLDRARAALHTRGMKLIVDFIPNHFGFDHPWTRTHPDRFVCGSEEAFRASPTTFRLVELDGHEPRYIARARDPYFLPWSDVAQIDYSKEDTRRAMVEQLRRIASHADGARCDMAMLVLSDVFSNTWHMFVEPWNATREFWEDARAAIPEFLLIAEVYWDMEYRLQGLGFDYTYDKRLYDRLLHENAESIAGHLQADPVYQSKSARFIENHDEPRSAESFGPRVRAAACAMSTIPGLRFYYDGQFEGRKVRLPMQLGADVEEQIDNELAAFYARLLSIVDEDVFHDGSWTLCDVERDGEAPDGLLAWRWKRGADIRLVVVNMSHGCAHGRVQLTDDLAAADRLVFEELLSGTSIEHAAADLRDGLPLRLASGEAAIFSVHAGGSLRE